MRSRENNRMGCSGHITCGSKKWENWSPLKLFRQVRDTLGGSGQDRQSQCSLDRNWGQVYGCPSGRSLSRGHQLWLQRLTREGRCPLAQAAGQVPWIQRHRPAVVGYLGVACCGPQHCNRWLCILRVHNPVYPHTVLSAGESESPAPGSTVSNNGNRVPGVSRAHSFNWYLWSTYMCWSLVTQPRTQQSSHFSRTWRSSGSDRHSN